MSTCEHKNTVLKGHAMDMRIICQDCDDHLVSISCPEESLISKVAIEWRKNNHASYKKFHEMVSKLKPASLYAMSAIIAEYIEKIAYVDTIKIEVNFFPFKELDIAVTKDSTSYLIANISDGAVYFW